MVVFVDEIDALARSRDADSHEASRRLLALLLQRMEGFNGKSRWLLLCATNRRKDLDEAMLSRFDLVLSFPLPDAVTRAEVFKRYAKHLKAAALYDDLAAAADGLSCREIKEACEQAERTFASKIIDGYKSKVVKGQGSAGKVEFEKSLTASFMAALGDSLPTVNDYHASIRQRKAVSVVSDPNHGDTVI